MTSLQDKFLYDFYFPVKFLTLPTNRTRYLEIFYWNVRLLSFFNLFIIIFHHVSDVSSKTMSVEEMETLCLHELVILLNVIEANDASDDRNVPLCQELSTHLNEFEHDRTSRVFLALIVHVIQQRCHCTLLQSSWVPHSKSWWSHRITCKGKFLLLTRNSSKLKYVTYPQE